VFVFYGADGRNRTADLLITNQLLCRLSYVGSAYEAVHLRCEVLHHPYDALADAMGNGTTIGQPA
jgi:hypothetical protein